VGTVRYSRRSERWLLDVLYIFCASVGFHQRFDGVMVITFASHSVRERFRVRSSVESLFLSIVPPHKNRAYSLCMVCVLWIHCQSVSWHWLANLCRCEQKRCRDIFFRIVLVPCSAARIGILSLFLLTIFLCLALCLIFLCVAIDVVKKNQCGSENHAKEDHPIYR
jgi:hypothetical protein